MPIRFFLAAFGLSLLLHTAPIAAVEIRVAVASNFSHAIKAIVRRFEETSGHRVKLIVGSTGKHYAQIKHGAPFDAYFAADSRRPRLLQQQGIALPDSLFTYALGHLVLWSPIDNYVDPEGAVLASGTYRHLSIANPKLAPYGKAAQQVLQARGLWTGLRTRMVRGENIGQAYHFINGANTELGFVALSQLKQPGTEPVGSYWLVPTALYSPIEQQAVQLRDNPATHAFMRFIKSTEIQQLIRSYGYTTPQLPETMTGHD